MPSAHAQCCVADAIVLAHLVCCSNRVSSLVLPYLSHQLIALDVQENDTPVCKFHPKGQCKNGTQCPFIHENPNGSRTPTAGSGGLSQHGGGHHSGGHGVHAPPPPQYGGGGDPLNNISQLMQGKGDGGRGGATHLSCSLVSSALFAPPLVSSALFRKNLTNLSPALSSSASAACTKP